MSDIPEPAKKIQRLMMLVIIVGLVGAVVYVGAEWLSPKEEVTDVEN